MRLVTFEVMTHIGRVARLGALRPDGGVIDLNSSAFAYFRELGEPRPREAADYYVPSDMLEFIRAGREALKMASEVSAFAESATSSRPVGQLPRLIFSQDEVRLKAPLPRPLSLRDFITFEEHVRDAWARRGQPVPEAWYEFPVYYKGNPLSIIGPDDDVIWPRYTQLLDYELELACVIGREGRDIPEAEAWEHIFGFTIMNDFSARDIQRKEMSTLMGPSKGKDFATALGPCLVTRDQIGDVRNLRMVARVNGEVWSEGNSGTSYWTFQQMIAHASMGETLYPGEVLGSGTVGKGCGVDVGKWLKPGDVVELEIENIGVLRNRIVRHEG
jgi:2-keto-4-pentenoate hydratase/2-oxohepta-3-ene-1,7-dioic acid hydratase in catechol pathway